jgi:hypothetical protein
LADFKNKINSGDFDLEKDNLMVAHNLLHAADISTPIKVNFEVCKEWADRVLLEFFR